MGALHIHFTLKKKRNVQLFDETTVQCDLYINSKDETGECKLNLLISLKSG
jgi:hypothetical protein